MPDAKEKCHYCDRENVTWFLYDLNDDIDSTNRSKIPVCGVHFNKLCDMTYVNGKQAFLSAGQKEYVSVKRLERELGITTHHK